jgi:hypothetical protein
MADSFTASAWPKTVCDGARERNAHTMKNRHQLVKFPGAPRHAAADAIDPDRAHRHFFGTHCHHLSWNQALPAGGRRRGSSSRGAGQWCSHLSGRGRFIAGFGVKGLLVECLRPTDAQDDMRSERVDEGVSLGVQSRRRGPRVAHRAAGATRAVRRRSTRRSCTPCGVRPRPERARPRAS